MPGLWHMKEKDINDNIAEYILEGIMLYCAER